MEVFLSGVRSFTFTRRLSGILIRGARGNVSRRVSSKSRGRVIHCLLRPYKLGCKGLPGNLLAFRHCSSIIHATIRRRLVRTYACRTGRGNRYGIRFAMSPRRVRLFGALIREITPNVRGDCRIGFGMACSVRGPSASAVTMATSGAPFHGSSNSVLFHPNKRNTLVRGLGSLSTSIIFVGGVSGISSSLGIHTSMAACRFMVTNILMSIRRGLFGCLHHLSTKRYSSGLLSRVTSFYRRALLVGGGSVHNGSGRRRIECFATGLGHPVHVYNVIHGRNRPNNNPCCVGGDSNDINLRVLRDSRVSGSGGRCISVVTGSARFGPISLVYSLGGCHNRGFSLLGCISRDYNFVSDGSGGNIRLGTLRLPNL